MSKAKKDKVVEAERKKFLSYVREMAKYWAEQKDMAPLEVAMGTAFSILVALDGEACGCGPYSVKPIDTEGKEGKDIAGNLHHNIHD